MKIEKILSKIPEICNDIIYLSDIETYELIYLNKATKKILNIPDDYEIKNLKCYEVIQGRNTPCDFCTNAQLEEREPYVWEFYNEALKKYFLLRDWVVSIEGRKTRLEIATDITNQKELEKSIGYRLSVEKMLTKCIATLQKNVSIENAVNNILEYIGGFYKADRAYVFEIDNNKQIINNTYEWCDESIEPEIDNLQCLPIKSIERWLKAFEEEEYIYISSLEKIVDHDSLEYEVLEMQGIETLIAAPFFDNEEQIVGFIGVDNPSEHKGAANLLISIADFIVNDLEKRSLIEELEKKSFTDMLTGLGNRNAFFYRLEELKKESELSIGVIYMDINDLKSLNSKHGNFCGDVILKKTAEHMFATLKNDIYRIGGDEFVAICVGVSKTEFSEIIKKVKNALESEFEYSVSMGMKWRSGDNDIEAILNEAEEIMLVEKMEFYRNAERNKITRYTFFEEEIKSDISRDKYEVFFQPKVDLQNGEVIGAEALIRKKEKEGEYISPAKFVTHLEKEGLIRYIDFFVLETVCRMLKEWDKRGTLIQCISVNFSRITLMDKNVFNKITEICDKYSVDYGRITIEVTESIGKIDSQYLRVLLDKIQKNGFRVSLDDFGSRYSNLAILSMISFDEIKFDKSIVENIIEDNKSEVIINHTIKMGKELGIFSFVAEGIEEKGQMNLLRKMGCNFGQGYLFSRPVPVSEFEVMLGKKWHECKKSCN